MWSKKFWQKALERAVKTGAQFVLLVVIGGNMLPDTSEQMVQVNAWLLDWQTIGGVFLGGVFVSLLTSLATSELGTHKDDPSLV